MDRDEQTLAFGVQCLNEGAVIGLPAIPVPGRCAADGKRLRFGLSSRHRNPLSVSGPGRHVAPPFVAMVVA